MRQLSHAARDWLRNIRRAGRRFFLLDQGIAAVVKLPIFILLGGIRHAPLGTRRRFWRCARPSMSAPLPALPAEHCEITSLANFETSYTRLAVMLGYAGKTPAPGELEFLGSIAGRRTYYEGKIAPADHLFLTAFISILAPRRVVEIGTLTGFSAGIIAAAVSRQHGSDGASWVDTIDIHAQCAVDKTRPTGFEIAELFPNVASMIRLHSPHDASFVSQLAARDELEVAFIDADHRHPLILLDLLRLAPYMRPASWVLLHDIQLGTITRRALDAGQKTAFEPVYGAEWLFNRWPFRKISGGNIGAVQLPEQKNALVPFALGMMSIQFETSQKQARATRRAIYESLDALC
jgi:predicted O-methyltransferase YrrM